MRNIIRDEAVRITSDTMALLQSRSFSDMDGNGAADPNLLIFNNDQQRNIRNINNFPFTVTVNIQTLTATQKQLTVTTQWIWQGENFQHQIMTTRRE
ncbi:MAG: hypothetical protein LLG05_07050 [Porphyromonadaceae bacterium]|nr:hypothetical protein [Porphyromonadaceae bacterium]